jgi:hypothetical protein
MPAMQQMSTIDSSLAAVELMLFLDKLSVKTLSKLDLVCIFAKKLCIES